MIVENYKITRQFFTENKMAQIVTIQHSPLGRKKNLILRKEEKTTICVM